MAQDMTLRTFLDANKSDGLSTHTSMKGGKYWIPEDKLDQFYDLYVEGVKDNQTNLLYLTEKPTNIGPLRIDLDFVYDGKIDQHQHTEEQVVSFIKAYLETVGTYLILPPQFEVHIMEKRKPTYEKKGNRTKSGIHVVVPGVCTHKFVEQSVRRSVVKRMEEFFSGLPLKDDWEKVYDKGVVDRSNNWTLYKSRKNDIDDVTRPYETQYIMKYVDGEFTISHDVPPISVGLLKALSMRQPDSAETPMSEDGIKMYAGVRETNDKSEVAAGTEKRRGRGFQRLDKPSSRASSPAARILQPITAERREYLKSHVMNLNKSRADNYNTSGSDDKFSDRGWLNVGQLLFNVHPDLLDVFLDFSAQSDKYDELGCINQWNKYTYSNDGDRRLGEKSLIAWSREDNQAGFDDIERVNVDRLVLLAASTCTEHDVACVIHAKYKAHYMCSDFRNNVWYRWMGHVWQETDQGVDLLLKLSKQIASMFFERMTVLMKEMNNRGITTCTGEGKDDCKVCEYCQMEAQRLGLNKMYLQLKKTMFKNNVMRECRELFFDEAFNKKSDSNKELIAFNNGVLELDKFIFRDGKPEDYITFSTGIDYNAERSYEEYPAWPDVETFICQVLPDDEVRDYFMKHLATNLFGGNPAQKFHIMTGSGSNGKSMIMNLMSKAMGDYACTVPISLFTQQRKGSGNAAPEVIRLKGRRFVTMQEPDEKIALNTGLMKEITSGEKMYARDLFKSGMEFEVLAKFHLACNDKPKINTTDGGTWRRLMVINFLSKFVPVPVAPNEFPLNEAIQFSVNTVEWATPFMAFLVHTLKEGKGLRKLDAPTKVMQYTSDYRNENDAIAKFIEDKIVPVGAGEEIVQVRKEAVRALFRQWKIVNECMSIQPIELEKRLIAQFGAYPKGGWTNFRLADD
jgi:P4 family phage/plasmid primase-like protien